MGTGWRRAFCTTIPRDREKTKVGDGQPQPDVKSCQTPKQIPSPRSSSTKLGFLSSGSNPSPPRLQSQPVDSPRLRCRTSVKTSSTNTQNLVSPKLYCKTTSNTPKSSIKNPKPIFGSNPSSPRSPFSILKNSLRLYRNNCGVCMQSVKTGQGMAIYTAECSHTFHFPCIISHVRKQSILICPVCKSSWKDVPLLAIHKLQQNHHKEDVEAKQMYSNNNHKKKEEMKQPSTPPSLTKLTQSDSLRTYDDDEPLLSPTAGVKFVPIPEVNEYEEEAEDEIQEFQGFFVNPIPSDDRLMNSRDSRIVDSVEVSLMPDAAVVSEGRTHDTYAIVLKVKAPPPPQKVGLGGNPDSARRAPIDLVTVLDVSGSMSGAKLQMLKRAMRLVIASLGSADRLSLVAFSSVPNRLMPLRRMTAPGQRCARRIIDRLFCGQGTSVAEALRKATKILEDRRERNPVASIMLLSDGRDESVHSSNTDRRRGSTNPSSTRFAHMEIPVHSFGFGHKSGGCYSREPNEDVFTKSVGGLLSVVVQDLRIHLEFASGSDPGEISAVYSCNGRPSVLGSDCIRLGDLYAEEEREVLLEIRVPSSVFGSHHVLSVRCNYKDPATQELINGRDQALLVPRSQTVRSSSPKIERLRNLFITTRAIAESRRFVELSNETSSAQHLLLSARALLMKSSLTSAEEYIRGLEFELAEVQWKRQCQEQIIQRRRMTEKEMCLMLDENGDPLTPTSAWRAAEKLAKVAMMKKSLNRVSDLHGFENARF